MTSFTSQRPGARAPLRSGFLPDRIIHLHPTLRCNMACLHCYSESDPRQKASLEPGPLLKTLALLRQEGYAVISFSGGEPLVYQSLVDVVVGAKSLGFRNTMISNGLLAAQPRQDVLALFDGVAISFDGMRDTHNAVRGRPDAFDRASAALGWLADSGMPAAAAISLSRNAIPQLPDLADHVVGLGARALQIRPVARAGRARSMDPGEFYEAADRARLYLVTLALRQELPTEVKVHCDLAPTRGLWSQRDDYAGLLGSCEADLPGERRLADLVNPLVITETGFLKPVAYDFHRRFDIDRVADVSAERLQRYKRERLADFQALIGGALAGMRERAGLVDWFDHCTRLSEAVKASDARGEGFRALNRE